MFDIYRDSNRPTTVTRVPLLLIHVLFTVGHSFVLVR